ncbi:MAG: T9SS type B sorting domain-containing protein [Ferruginibacter sp.]
MTYLQALKNFLLVITLLLGEQVSAQITCTPVFQKFYGGEPSANEEATAVTYCNGGGMIVCGQTTSYSAGQYDAFLLKLSDNGTPEWTRVIGSSGNDKLVKVRQTQDGGFIALGETTSYANTKGETWVVKTDASGTVQWNKRYNCNSQGVEKPKDLIQLADGTYCVAMNVNDGSVKSDAAVIKLSSAGIVLWAKVLDHGGADGVNNIAEYNDTLLVAGYATEDARDAIVTRLNKADGATISAKKFSNLAGYNDEALSIEVTSDGIAFSVSMYPTSYSNSYYPYWINHFRMNNQGDITYHRRAEATIGFGAQTETIQTRATDDKGFIDLLNDTAAAGHSKCNKVGPYGQFEWGRPFYDYGYAGRTSGMDITSNYGYVFAGFKNDLFATAQKNKIQVFKTDRIGKTGDCFLDLALTFIDTAHYSIASFNWQSNQPLLVQEQNNSMQTGVNNFTVINSCEKIVCDTVQVLPDSCSTNLMAEYSSELMINAEDIGRLSDGSYVFAGSYNYYWLNEPFITKTNSNGSIAWSKTYNSFIHDAHFLKILPVNNAMFVIGQDYYNINNGSRDSAIIMKIDFSGKVIWAKKYARNYTFFSDIKPTDDGGYIIFANDNTGGGLMDHPMIIKIDADGNMLWKKELTSLYLVLKNILVDKNFIYVYGSANYSFGASVILLKIAADNGVVVWQKNLRSTLTESLSALALEKTGDSLIAAVNIIKTLSNGHNESSVGFIKVNPSDGSTYGAYKITNINYQDPQLLILNGQSNPAWAAIAGSDVVFANSAALNNDTCLYISRVSSYGKLIWSKKYYNLKKNNVASIKYLGDGIVLTGDRPTGVKKDGYVYEHFPYILKTDEKGNIANAPVSPTCINADYGAVIDTFSVMDDYPFISAVITLPENNSVGYLTAKSYQPYVRDIKKNWKVFCNTISNCNNIQINGPDSICNLQDTLVFTLQKNAGCTATAVWQTDTTLSKILAFTDSTIRLKLIKPGTILLNASIISGCTGLSAQKIIHITRPATSLNLGPDTTLCANNTYTLKAGTGFKTYLWSQALGNDSILIVSNPGLYILTVTDYCGNQFKDSVMIKSANFLFSAGNDTSKCNKDSVMLSVTPGFINYAWQPAYNLLNLGPEKVKVFPDVDTFYVVKAEKWPGCFVSDTVHIAVKISPPILLGADTSICKGQTVVLNAGNNFGTYQWSTGDINQEIITGTAGTYSVNAITVDGCHSSAAIHIAAYPVPMVTLDHTTTLCYGTTRTLDAGNYISFTWQDGSTNRTFKAVAPGTYHVTVTDNNGCNGSDTVHITQLLPLPANFLPSDTAICNYGEVILRPNNSYTAYLWSTGDLSSSIKVTHAGIYTLEATNQDHCKGIDTIKVLPKDCMEGVYIPTAFSPNHDGKNDVFRPMIFGNVVQFEWTIYNRFGQPVFSSKKPSEGWDGNVNGIKQNSGGFTWHCWYQFVGKAAQVMSGSVLLVR